MCRIINWLDDKLDGLGLYGLVRYRDFCIVKIVLEALMAIVVYRIVCELFL